MFCLRSLCAGFLLTAVPCRGRGQKWLHLKEECFRGVAERGQWRCVGPVSYTHLLNAERLQKAVENEDVDEMAAVSHNMIPLFTLIGAAELVALLKLLEASHVVPFTGELKEHALAALVLIEDVIDVYKRQV